MSEENREVNPGLPAPITPQSTPPATLPAAAAENTPAPVGAVEPVWPSPAVPSPAVPGATTVPTVTPVRTSSSAIIALVLAIASWVICPIIPAIVALVFAAKADREVRASNGAVTSSGLSTSAKIVAWVNIGVGAAVIAAGVFVLFLALLAGGFGSIGQV